MTFDYYYGRQAEQFAFYQIPKLLVTDDRFANISTDAKLLYSLMLDRAALSTKNGWLDAEGRVYIIYTLEQIMADMHCANQKATKMMKELEDRIGLIERKKQGQGKPALIYVKDFTTGLADERPDPSSVQTHENHDSESHEPSLVLTHENHESGDVKIMTQDSWKSHANNTDIKETENNKTNPINLSAEESPMKHSALSEIDGMDEMESHDNPLAIRKSYEDYFKNKLEYDCLLQKYPYDHGRINEIIDVLVDTVCSTAKTIRIGGEDRPTEVVKSRFMKLDYSHMEYMLDCFHDNTTEIHNIKKYMLTMLYNASLTIDHYYQSKVSHDMYGRAEWE